MIATHQQQLELRLPRIGVIRKGAPKPEKGPGKDLDYFRLDRADPSVVMVWDSVFGPEPNSISGILPYADPAENLNIWDELWQGKRLLWRGDGERLHVRLEGNGYVRYAPGQGPAQPAAAGQMVDKLKVARISRLRLLLPQLRIAGVFEIASSSTIDADELWANLMWIRSTVATLQGAPVTVFRAARQFNVPQADGRTMVVTKHMLHMMLDGRYLDALMPVAGQLPAGAPPAALPAAVGPVDDDHGDEPDDEPEEGVFEDAPKPQFPRDYVAGKDGEMVYRGPMPDDEVAIGEATAGEFIGKAAEFLHMDEAAVKDRMKALGYTTIPGKPAERVKAYRAMKTTPDEVIDAAIGDLFGEVGRQPVNQYEQD